MNSISGFIDKHFQIRPRGESQPSQVAPPLPPEAPSPSEVFELRSAPGQLATPLVESAPGPQQAPAPNEEKRPAYVSPQGIEGRLLSETTQSAPEMPTSKGLGFIARQCLQALRSAFSIADLKPTAALLNVQPGQHEGAPFKATLDELRTAEWQVGQGLKFAESGQEALAKTAVQGGFDRYAGRDAQAALLQDKRTVQDFSDRFPGSRELRNSGPSNFEGREVAFIVRDEETGMLKEHRGRVQTEGDEFSSMFRLHGQEGVFNKNGIEQFAVIEHYKEFSRDVRLGSISTVLDELTPKSRLALLEGSGLSNPSPTNEFKGYEALESWRLGQTAALLKADQPEMAEAMRRGAFNNLQGQDALQSAPTQMKQVREFEKHFKSEGYKFYQGERPKELAGRVVHLLAPDPDSGRLQPFAGKLVSLETAKGGGSALFKLEGSDRTFNSNEIQQMAFLPAGAPKFDSGKPFQGASYEACEQPAIVPGKPGFATSPQERLGALTSAILSNDENDSTFRILLKSDGASQALQELRGQSDEASQKLLWRFDQARDLSDAGLATDARKTLLGGNDSKVGQSLIAGALEQEVKDREQGARDSAATRGFTNKFYDRATATKGFYPDRESSIWIDDHKNKSAAFLWRNPDSGQLEEKQGCLEGTEPFMATFRLAGSDTKYNLNDIKHFAVLK